MFCGVCGKLLLGIPNEKGVVVCFECYEETKPEPEHLNNKTVSELKTRTYDVIENLKRVTTDSYPCPKCGEREATCELRQMDQTDEPEVAFLECQVCMHGWRD